MNSIADISTGGIFNDFKGFAGAKSEFAGILKIVHAVA
jgi:hypothetical protein